MPHPHAMIDDEPAIVNTGIYGHFEVLLPVPPFFLLSLTPLLGMQRAAISVPSRRETDN